MKKLEKCPFCGGRAEVIVTRMLDPRVAIAVRCVDCLIGTAHFIVNDTEKLQGQIDELYDEWNRRVYEVDE